MGKVQDLLNLRLKKAEKSSKMAVMAKQSASGELTSFSGFFGIVDLSSSEQEALQNMLESYATESAKIQHDLSSLISITSEVKAINNQAALLHGERIKQAQNILKRYRDGAFTAWMMMTYGNRQTPYNFLQYFEFYRLMPKTLQKLLDKMPRQAVYTLASRDGSMERKKEIIQNFQGETKQQLLGTIREAFPLDESDRRRYDLADDTIQNLEKVLTKLMRSPQNLKKRQKERIYLLLDEIHLAISSPKSSK